MKNLLINATVVIILLFITSKLYKLDRIDLTNPFGTDNDKNLKYAKGKTGEDYGVGTFWGKPHTDDNLSKHLDKIQWLSHSLETDVIWRRSLIASIIFGIIIAISTYETPFLSKLFLSIFAMFSLSYFSINYYKHHIILRRIKFIDTHIRRTKTKLNLPLNNQIFENPLL